MATQILREDACAMVQYTDATYDYFCLAPPGTAVATENWRIRRVKLDGTAVAWPTTQLDNPTCAATSLAVVQAYFA